MSAPDGHPAPSAGVPSADQDEPLRALTADVHYASINDRGLGVSPDEAQRIAGELLDMGWRRVPEGSAVLPDGRTRIDGQEYEVEKLGQAAKDYPHVAMLRPVRGEEQP